MNTKVDVVKGLFVFLVDNDFNVFFGYVFLFEVLFDELTCFVRRAIIYVNNVIVVVILHKDRIQVSKVQSALYIIV